MAFGVGVKLDEKKITQVKSEFKMLLKDIQAITDKHVINIKMQNANNQINNMNRSLSQTNTHFKTLGSSVQSIGSFFLKWYGTSQAILFVIREMKDAVKFINNVDTSITNIAMVTGKAKSEVQGYLSAWNQLARDMKVEGGTQSIVTAVEELLRAGMDLETANENLKTNIMLTRLSGENGEETAKKLIKISEAYKLNSQGLRNISEEIAYLDTTTATSTGNILNSLTGVSQVAQQTKVSQEFLLSSIATIQERSGKAPEAVARALKSIFLDLQKVTTDTSKEGQQALSKLEGVLSRQGVALRLNATTFKSNEDILKSLMAKWNQFDDVTKKKIQQYAGGKNFAEEFNIIMNEQNTILQRQIELKGVSGSLESKYQEHLNSTQAAVNELKASVERLYINTIDGGFIKSIVNATTGLVNFIDKIGIVNIGIIALTGYLIKMLTTTKVAEMLGMWVLGLTNVALSMATLKIAIGGVVAAIGLIGMAIYNYNQKQAQAVQNAIDHAAALDQEEKQVKSLMNEYKELSEKTSKTADEKERLKTVEDELQKLYPNINIELENQKKGYEGVKIAIEEMSEARRQDLIDELTAIQIRDKAKRASLEKDKENAEKLENELKGKKTAEMVTDIGGFNPATKIYVGPFKNVKVLTGDEGEALAKSKYLDALNKRRELEEEIKKYDNINTQLEYLKNYKPTTTKPKTTTSGDSNGKDYITGGGSNAAKAEIADLSIKIDRYMKLNNSIEDVRNQISSLNRVESSSDKIEVAQKKITLMEKQKQLTKDLQIEQKKEADELQKTILANKFTFDDKGEISNYSKRLGEMLRDSNKKTGDAKRDAQEKVKAVSDSISRYTDLVHKEIPSTVKDWDELTVSITALREEIDKIKVDKLINEMDKMTSGFESSIDAIKDKIELVGDFNLGTWSTNQGELITKIQEYEQYLQKVISELRQQQSELVAGSDAWNLINDKIADAVDQARHLKMEAISIAQDIISGIAESNRELSETNSKAQEQAIQNQIDDLENQQKAMEDAIQSQIDALEEEEKLRDKYFDNEKQRIDDEENLFEEMSNAKIESIRKQIEALEKQNDIITEEEERQKRVIELEKLKQQLQNAENQKTVQQLTKKEDGSWDYIKVADAENITKIREEIQDKEKEFMEWERDNTLKHQKELLEEQIELEENVQKERKKSFDQQRKALEDQAKREKELYDQRKKALQDNLESERKMYESRKEALQNSLEQSRTMVEQNNEEIENLVKQLMDAIRNNVDGSMDSLIQSLGQKLGLAQSQVQQLLQLSQQANTTPGSGNNNPNPGGSTNNPPPDNGGYQPPPGNWQPPPDSNVPPFDPYNLTISDYQRALQMSGLAVAINGIMDVATRAAVTQFQTNNGLKVSPTGAVTPETIAAFRALLMSRFATGGETQTTGIHWLDGQVGKPERVLSAEQTQSFNKLVNNLPKVSPILENLKNLPALKSASGVVKHFHIAKMELPNVTNESGLKRVWDDIERLSLQYDPV